MKNIVFVITDVTIAGSRNSGKINIDEILVSISSVKMVADVTAYSCLI